MITARGAFDKTAAVVAALPLLGIAELESKLRGLVFGAIVVVSVALADRTSTLIAYIADGHIIINPVVRNALAACRIRTVCPISRFKLHSFLGESDGQFGGNVGPDGIKGHALTAAARRIHCLITDSILEESGHAAGTISVTTWCWQCLRPGQTIKTSLTECELQSSVSSAEVSIFRKVTEPSKSVA